MSPWLPEAISWLDDADRFCLETVRCLRSSSKSAALRASSSRIFPRLWCTLHMVLFVWVIAHYSLAGFALHSAYIWRGQEACWKAWKQLELVVFLAEVYGQIYALVVLLFYAFMKRVNREEKSLYAVWMLLLSRALFFVVWRLACGLHTDDVYLFGSLLHIHRMYAYCDFLYLYSCGLLCCTQTMFTSSAHYFYTRRMNSFFLWFLMRMHSFVKHIDVCLCKGCIFSVVLCVFAHCTMLDKS